ncbi:helix-turn-helix domain-containing protein [Thermoactinomyces sp. DSM 45892]|uniref:helix-turn-helix domain-containing protein n=1 Tax=Thermoactinomyces sp. DSM 45892 TaxID=1882753 RepID=UPI0015A1B98D|nr:helix-turn-helix domain-containing protein [Thermoactinomyces sp. DSM 45892]
MSTTQDKAVFESENESLGFTIIPNVILTSTVLTPTEKIVYGILRRYANLPKGCMPAVSTVCLEANISKATYNRAIKTFIRSTENPNPAIPLITIIHRPNQSNEFKFHDITDHLVELLKSAVQMEEEEKKIAKAKKKRKKAASKSKSGSQNDTPIENTGESQNETHIQTSQNETPPVSNCDTSNNELNKKEQQQPEVLEKDVVVVVDFIQEKFQKLYTAKQVKRLLTLAKNHGEDLIACIENANAYDKRVKKLKSVYGGIEYAIKEGWDVPPPETTKPTPAKPLKFDDFDLDEIAKELSVAGGVRR